MSFLPITPSPSPCFFHLERLHACSALNRRNRARQVPTDSQRLEHIIKIACSDHCEDDQKKAQRPNDVSRWNRGNPFAGPHQIVDKPRLPTHFIGDPAKFSSEETERMDNP